ncbi:MAG TPA: amino acid adenylation domain-containing protein [Umezawaea sp.]|nr:amino acid adenylation domain-containing protein [Umezawaea sp.]
MSEALEAVERHARRGPDDAALVVGGEVLTYRELVDTAAELAGRLAAVGAGPGRTVVLHLPQGMAALVGMVAVLRTGAAWTVVEPGHPAVRLDSALAVADCAAVVHLGDVGGPLGAVDRPPPLVDFAARGPLTPVPPVVADGRHPAYLVLTSGTTGRPKAVVISRANLDVAIAGHTGLYGPAPVFMPVMSVSFDGVLSALFSALGTGGTVVVPDARELRDPVAVAHLAARHRITHSFTVPSFHHLLLDRADLLPDSLDLCLVGGEAVTPALVERHRAALPGTRLVNVYGPTETSIICTAHPVVGSPKRTVPIGRPFDRATARVLDARLRPLPPGRIGELYIGGEYVGPGYAHDPGRTAERFVADPHGDGTTMYRTGDLARVDQSGELEFHGRTDDQVKVRGTRVELGEVEHVVQGHDGVRQAAVVVAPDAGLVAFVVPVDADRALGERLRAWCALHLLDQAVPAVFVPVERIPLTHNGKADRAALRALVPATTPDPAAVDEGWTERQREVAAEWGAVLRHHDAGLRDTFWHAGGTSLKLMDLYERLDARWPGALRVGELFEFDTIEAQAAAVAARAEGDGPGAPAPTFRFEV